MGIGGGLTNKAMYLPGPRGVEYRRDDVAGTVRWYVYDGLGSVMGEVSPDGTLTRTQSFDVYGAVRTFVRHRDDEAQVRGITRAPVG